MIHEVKDRRRIDPLARLAFLQMHRLVRSQDDPSIKAVQHHQLHAGAACSLDELESA